MFDSLKSAFAHPVDNFEEGLAGIGDALGITDHAAAKVYVSQSASAFASADAQADALAAAETKEDATGLLSAAGMSTATDLVDVGGDTVQVAKSAVRKTVAVAKEAVEGVATEVGNVESKILGPLTGPLLIVAVVAVVGAAIYFGPELKAVAHRLGGAA